MYCDLKIAIVMPGLRPILGKPPSYRSNKTDPKILCAETVVFHYSTMGSKQTFLYQFDDRSLWIRILMMLDTDSMANFSCTCKFADLLVHSVLLELITNLCLNELQHSVTDLSLFKHMIQSIVNWNGEFKPLPRKRYRPLLEFLGYQDVKSAVDGLNTSLTAPLHSEGLNNQMNTKHLKAGDSDISKSVYGNNQSQRASRKLNLCVFDDKYASFAITYGFMRSENIKLLDISHLPALVNEPTAYLSGGNLTSVLLSLSEFMQELMIRFVVRSKIAESGLESGESDGKFNLYMLYHLFKAIITVVCLRYSGRVLMKRTEYFYNAGHEVRHRILLQFMVGYKLGEGQNIAEPVQGKDVLDYSLNNYPQQLYINFIDTYNYID